MAGGQTSAGQRFKCQDPEHHRFTTAQEARSTMAWMDVGYIILRIKDGAPEILRAANETYMHHQKFSLTMFGLLIVL